MSINICQRNTMFPGPLVHFVVAAIKKLEPANNLHFPDL